MIDWIVQTLAHHHYFTELGHSAAITVLSFKIPILILVPVI